MAGNYVYVTAGPYGLVIIDASNPAQPSVVGTFPAQWSNSFTAVTVQGHYAYVASLLGLDIINVSDPAAPNDDGYWPLDDEVAVQAVAVQGNYAYLTVASEYGFRVINVSNTMNPVEVGRCYTVFAPTALAINGSRAYLTIPGQWGDPERFLVLSTVVPGNPHGTYWCAVPADVRDIAVTGHTALVAGLNSLRVVDIAPNDIPTVIGMFDYPGGIPAVAAADNFASVAVGDSGLRILDLRQLPAITEIGRLCFYGVAASVAMDSAYAYVADQTDPGGLAIYAIGDPATPRRVGFAETGWAEGVIVREHYAYVNTGQSLSVVDIANPAQPQQEGSSILLDGLTDFALYGNYAYVVTGVYLWVLDISDPVAPVLVGGIWGNEGEKQVATDGSYAYVSSGADGLAIFDVRNPGPDMPPPVFLDTPGFACDVALAGLIACIADGDSGLRVFDVSNPILPLEVGVCPLPCWARDMTIRGHYLFVADSLCGLRVIDLGDPAAPVEVGFYDTPGHGTGVAVHGDRVCIADYSYLGLYDVSTFLGVEPGAALPTPAAFALGQNFPNPFNATTVIPFALPRTARVSLKVYDLLGREVAALVDGVMASGEHRVTWQAEAAASGVYFMRLVAGEHAMTHKVLLVR